MWSPSRHAFPPPPPFPIFPSARLLPCDPRAVAAIRHSQELLLDAEWSRLHCTGFPPGRLSYLEASAAATEAHLEFYRQQQLLREQVLLQREQEELRLLARRDELKAKLALEREKLLEAQLEKEERRNKKPAQCRWCRSSFEAFALPAHEALCEQRAIPCPHCGALFPSCRMPSHSASCDRRTVYCKWCSEPHDASCQHEGGCGHRPLACRWCSCCFTANEVADHEARCELRMVQCSLCKVPQPAATLEAHERSACAQRPVICKCCNKTVTGGDLKVHFAICSQQLVSCCHCGSPISLLALPDHEAKCASVVKCESCGRREEEYKIRIHGPPADGPCARLMAAARAVLPLGPLLGVVVTRPRNIEKFLPLGIHCRRIVENKPCELGGMLADDHIQVVAGQPTRCFSHFMRAVAGLRPGERVTLQILRGGVVGEVDVDVWPRELSNEAGAMVQRALAFGPTVEDIREFMRNPAMLTRKCWKPSRRESYVF